MSPRTFFLGLITPWSFHPLVNVHYVIKTISYICTTYVPVPVSVAPNIVPPQLNFEHWTQDSRRFWPSFKTFFREKTTAKLDKKAPFLIKNHSIRSRKQCNHVIEMTTFKISPQIINSTLPQRVWNWRR
jgi:hypothetical protein